MGFDIGTSSIKASIIDANNGQTIGTTSYPKQEMSIISHQPGWAEQDPEIWWTNVCQASKELLSLSEIDAQEIKSIGLTYQMHGLVLVNKELNPIRPSIIWCDSRAAKIGQEAFSTLGNDYCLQNYLNSPGNFTASKLKWVKDNEPNLYDSAYKMLLPGDYINMKFTGNLNTTISGLSEGILWNFKTQEIADRLIDHYALRKDLIPDLIGTFDESGKVTKSAAEATGLHPGTPITYRAGDQPNNAMALNVLQKGEVAATCGTSGVVYGITDNSSIDHRSRVNGFAHVNYEKSQHEIGILLCINGAGIGYSWMKNHITEQNSTFDQMERLATRVSVGSNNLITLPFGNGAERMFENKDIGAHIDNLNFNIHQRPHLYRSLLEGVAFSFVYGMQILKEIGLEIETLKVSNDNLFQSSIFSSTIANTLDTKIELIATTGAVGAAKAAGIATGHFGSLEEAFSMTKPSHVIHPQNERSDYTAAYEYWKTALNSRLQDH